MNKTRLLFILFSANIISGFSTGITWLAIPWTLVSQMGNEDGKFLNTVMMGVITVLSLFWGLYSGTLIDRYNRKNLFLFMNFIDAAILFCAAGIGFYFGKLPFMVIAAVATTTLFTFNLHYPNLYAIVQELFSPDEYKKVNSAIEVQGQATNFLGMTVAGFLLAGSAVIPWWPFEVVVEPWTLEQIFLMDGITYFIAFVLISFIQYTPSENRIIDRGPLMNRLVSGFNYLWNDRPLLIFGIASYMIFATLLVCVQVLFPLYISGFLELDATEGAVVFAEVEMMYTFGALTVGGVTLFLGRLTEKMNLIRQIILLLLVTSAVFGIWSVSKQVSLFIAGGFLLGIANSGTRILRITYIVRLVPNHMIGRVNSFFKVVNVTLRSLLIALFALPFFSGMESGGNVGYGMMVLGGVTFVSGITLIIHFSKFEQKAAYGK